MGHGEDRGPHPSDGRLRNGSFLAFHAQVRDKHEFYKADVTPFILALAQGEQMPKGIIARTRKDASHVHFSVRA